MAWNKISKNIVIVSSNKFISARRERPSLLFGVFFSFPSNWLTHLNKANFLFRLQNIGNSVPKTLSSLIGVLMDWVCHSLEIAHIEAGKTALGCGSCRCTCIRYWWSFQKVFTKRHLAGKRKIDSARRSIYLHTFSMLRNRPKT